MKIKPLILFSIIISTVFSSMLSHTAFADSDDQFYGAVHQTWLKPTPSNPGAEFGNVVALDGDTLVVGARHDSITVGVDTVYQSGAAYVYMRDGTTWTLQARLAASDAGSYDLFGSAVAIDGDTIIVGAVGSDGTDENGDDAPDMGAAYIFTRSGDQWKQEAKIEPEDGIGEDYFGNSVVIVGTRIVVAASSKDIGSSTDAGKVYSYYRSGTNWYQSQSVSAPKISEENFFGSSIAYDGQRLVVGAQAAVNNTGAAYIYYRVGSTWTLEEAIEPEDDHSGDNFGASVSIDGQTIVVGAPFSDPDLGAGNITNAGAAYVFRKTAAAWNQEAKLVFEQAVAFDQFGQAVSIDDTTIIVGARMQDYYTILRTGAAHVFERSAGEWKLQTSILSGEPYKDADFGASLAFDDELIVVGEPGSDTQNNAGTVHIYSLQAGILPNTGFSPNMLSESKTYQPQPSHSSTLQIKIPKFDLQTSIVGVQRQGKSWDVSQLTTSVGYLAGTAYLSHSGNSVIAGHVNLPDGSEGPFANIEQLKWGDKIIIQMEGHRYIYEVRDVFDTSPTDVSILERDGDYAWLTLITCKDFDPVGEEYGLRTVVIAVRTE